MNVENIIMTNDDVGDIKRQLTEIYNISLLVSFSAWRIFSSTTTNNIHARCRYNCKNFPKLFTLPEKNISNKAIKENI